MASQWRPRIGLITVRFTLFDPQMGPAFPGRMRAHAARSAELLGKLGDVIETPLIETEADAPAVARALAEAHPEVVVFAPAMAAPPSFAIRALEGVVAPLVIWNAPAIDRLPADLHQDEATVHSTSVGSVMLGNVLVRHGRPFQVVTAGHDDVEGLATLARVVRAAAVAGSLRGSTVLRLGDPIAGYLDVEAEAADLARLGMREIAIPRDTWAAAVRAVPDDRADGLLADLQARWPGDPGPAGRDSARIAIALGDALDAHDAAGGTVNCHGPWFRTGEDVGLTACLGVACQTEAGRPFACTGDQPTGIALVIARRLTGRALYCECYTPERASGLVLIAAGGEGDPAWADPPGIVTLEENDHYPGARGRATSVAFSLQRGPATLLSLSPTDAGWVLAWAPGEIVETRYRNMRGPNAMFRFDSGPGGEALARWIGSGATHHNALAPGRLDVEIPALAGALGIRQQRV